MATDDSSGLQSLLAITSNTDENTHTCTCLHIYIYILFSFSHHDERFDEHRRVYETARLIHVHTPAGTRPRNGKLIQLNPIERQQRRQKCTTSCGWQCKACKPAGNYSSIPPMRGLLGLDVLEVRHRSISDACPKILVRVNLIAFMLNIPFFDESINEVIEFRSSSLRL